MTPKSKFKVAAARVKSTFNDLCAVHTNNVKLYSQIAGAAVNHASKLQSRFHKVLAERSKLRKKIFVMQKMLDDAQTEKEDFKLELSLSEGEINKLKQDNEALKNRNHSLELMLSIESTIGREEHESKINALEADHNRLIEEHLHATEKISEWKIANRTQTLRYQLNAVQAQFDEFQGLLHAIPHMNPIQFGKFVKIMKKRGEETLQSNESPWNSILKESLVK